MEAEIAIPEITLTAPNHRLGISNFEKNCTILSSPIWRQNLQLQRVPWQSLTTEITISTFAKLFIIKFSEKFWKKIQKNVISWKLKETYWEIIKRKHIGRQISQHLKVPWQSLTIQIIISSFAKFFIIKFSEKFWKNSKKRHISKTTGIWAAIIKGKIHNPLRVTSHSNNSIEIFKVLEFLTFKFFLKNSDEIKKKRHISKTTKIWAVNFGGEIRNS